MFTHQYSRVEELMAENNVFFELKLQNIHF